MVEEGPVGFSCVEESADSVVVEVSSPEGGAFDAFDQVVDGFGWAVGDLAVVPVVDLGAPAPDGASQGVDFGWQARVLEFVGELVDCFWSGFGVWRVVDASDSFFGVPGVADFAVWVACSEQAHEFRWPFAKVWDCGLL